MLVLRARSRSLPTLLRVRVLSPPGSGRPRSACGSAASCGHDHSARRYDTGAVRRLVVLTVVRLGAASDEAAVTTRTHFPRRSPWCELMGLYRSGDL